MRRGCGRNGRETRRGDGVFPEAVQPLRNARAIAPPQGLWFGRRQRGVDACAFRASEKPIVRDFDTKYHRASAVRALEKELLPPMRKILIPAAMCAALAAGCSPLGPQVEPSDLLLPLGLAKPRPLAPSPVVDRAMKSIARLGYLKYRLVRECGDDPVDIDWVEPRQPFDYVDLKIKLNTSVNLNAAFRRAMEQTAKEFPPVPQKSIFDFQEPKYKDPDWCLETSGQYSKEDTIFRNEIIPDLRRNGY